MTLSRIHVFIAGRVQGVAYRYFAQRRANELAATGWVRNLYDGRVEIIAEGEKDSLERLIEHLRQGPRLARVDDLDVRWEEALGEFADFKVEFSSF